MHTKKRYVQVGVGGRARLYYEALVTTYKDTTQFTAICDINKKRMEYTNDILKNKLGHEGVKMYGADEFEKMIHEQKPDCVIVTSIDRTHHRYIIKAMEMGCDVITEKPMTIDNVKCQQIMDTVKATGKKLRVTFNYRYAPHHSKIRELIMNDTIGKVNAVHFEWFLNTSHGADYFRRWHRDKRNSGGLLVHKATHHFDLVNFWLGTVPKTVYAQGDLMFYGIENAEERGITDFYYRTHGSPKAQNDPFAFVMKGNETLEGLYLNAEHEDGYLRDQSVFSSGISIEDTMSVLVRYASGAMMSYSLNAYSPLEGYKIVFTGTKGRIEAEVIERVYINAQGDSENEGVVAGKSITVYPMFANSYKADIKEGAGGHGGGDPVLLDDLFAQEPAADPLKRAATHIDGAMSILTGVAANKSIASGMPISINSLVQF
jgi:predicted dehydrogenase